MVAPEEPGEYTATWRMHTDAGDYVGAPVVLRIVVVEGAEDTPGQAALTRP